MLHLHGWSSVFTSYAFSALGVLFGLINGRAPLARIFAFPLWTIPILLAAALILDRKSVV